MEARPLGKAPEVWASRTVLRTPSGSSVMSNIFAGLSVRGYSSTVVCDAPVSS